MSNNSSDTEAEFGQNAAAANASVAPSNLAALRTRHLEPLVEDPNWHNTDGPGFCERFSAAQYHVPGGNAHLQQTYKRPDSVTSSMAVSLSTNRSGDFGSLRSVTSPPSLYSSSSLNTSSSMRTSDAEDFLEPDILEEGSGGALEVPVGRQLGRLACSFSFLACPFKSDNLIEWDTHCQSHFHGHLPRTVHCPFICAWNQTSNSGREAWHARILHIVGQHRGDGIIDTSRRPDDSLIQHLWNKKLIDAAQLKDLRKHGRLDRPQIFLRSAGMRERRMDRSSHPPAVRV